MLDDNKSLNNFFERVNGGEQPRSYNVTMSSDGVCRLFFRSNGKRYVYSFDLTNESEFINFALIKENDLEGVSEGLISKLLS